MNEDDIACIGINCCKCNKYVGYKDITIEKIKLEEDGRLFCITCNQLPHYICLSKHNIKYICLGCLGKENIES